MRHTSVGLALGFRLPCCCLAAPRLDLLVSRCCLALSARCGFRLCSLRALCVLSTYSLFVLLHVVISKPLNLNATKPKFLVDELPNPHPNKKKV